MREEPNVNLFGLKVLKRKDTTGKQRKKLSKLSVEIKYNIMRMKYIMTEYSPVLFNECLNHSDIAKCTFNDLESAGFVNIRMLKNDLEVTTYGESVSLGLKPKPEDAARIKTFLLDNAS